MRTCLDEITLVVDPGRALARMMVVLRTRFETRWTKSCAARNRSDEAETESSKTLMLRTGTVSRGVGLSWLGIMIWWGYGSKEVDSEVGLLRLDERWVDTGTLNARGECRWRLLEAISNTITWQQETEKERAKKTETKPFWSLLRWLYVCFVLFCFAHSTEERRMKWWEFEMSEYQNWFCFRVSSTWLRGCYFEMKYQSKSFNDRSEVWDRSTMWVERLLKSDGWLVWSERWRRVWVKDSCRKVLDFLT